ncbi:MAG: hypothetical protein D6718_12825 [Acidobacteria bacterium]|nr:MAG: hypothetical protein D6718_12825 [Acidobacteriota bacterium]
MALTAMLFLAALSMLAIDHKIYTRDDARLEADREARHALERIARDLRMAGFGVDSRTIADAGPDGVAGTADDLVGQARIVCAAPYDLAFNADIDPEVGAVDGSLPGADVPCAGTPASFHTGAETIRYTLDSDGDGSVDGRDRGDEAEELIGRNDGLFLLRREVYGAHGTTNENPVGTVALVRGPVAYPSGARPTPLFLYWGRFDPDPALDLWGDDGSGGGIAGNGLLEPGELAALGPVTDEDADDDGVLDPGEDRNGDGVLSRRIDELIREIQVTITAETPYPDPDWQDPVRSTSGSPFRFRSSTIASVIRPRNLDLPGGACGGLPQPPSGLHLANACPDPLADGRVRLEWTASPDDGGGEGDVERYLVYRTEHPGRFGQSALSETAAGTTQWTDEWMDLRGWPPRQYWYRVRAMDCTPSLSREEPVAGPYPPEPGPAFPPEARLVDPPGNDGTSLEVRFSRSPDDPANTTGYGGPVSGYHVYRSRTSDYRCVAPVSKTAVPATGAAEYAYVDDASNSTSPPAFGELYYYWIRSEDDAGRLSPYGPRLCGRPYRGPAPPRGVRARIADRGPGDRPVELVFSPNPDNDSAGYDPYLVDYRIYRSHDTDGDGVADSLVGDSAGYTENDLAASVRWTGTVWAFSHNGAQPLHRSLDGGTNWRHDASPSPSMLHDGAFADADVGLVVGHGGEILRTADGGANWSPVTSGTAANLQDVAFVSGSRALAAGDGGSLLRSEDGGRTWTAVASGTSARLVAVAAAGDVVVVAGQAGTLLRSLDGGMTFAPVNFTTENLFSVCAARESGGEVTIWAGATNRLWKSADSGASWTPVDLPQAGAVKALACAPGGAAVAAGDGPAMTVFATADGLGWNPEPVALAAGAWDAEMLDGRLAWVADQAGYVHRRDAAGAWTSVAVDTGQLRGLAVRPEIIWEDGATAGDPSGTRHHYVVTAAYAQGSPLDGEWGVVPDRPASVESPDDALDQILVDPCRDFELSIETP